MSRDNTFLPAALHARFIHRAHRWEIPQGTSIIDQSLTPASKGSAPWVVQLILGRVPPQRSLCHRRGCGS
eukprot:4398900-Pyramimonas_sp.AAC.1